MHRLRWMPLCLFVFAACAPHVASATTPPATLPPRVQTFLNEHCVDCHNADIQKNGFDLTALKFDLGERDAFDRWVHVLDRAAAGEMPPKTEDRPDPAALRDFTHELGTLLHAADAGRIAREGRVRARRLTRFEFERSLHELLGIDVPLANLLPAESRADGFDTVSSAQQVSHHLLERHLTAIDVALDAAFGRAAAPPPARRIELRKPQLLRLRPAGREPGPRPLHGDAVAWSTTVAFHGRMPPTKVPESGWYRLTLRVAAVNPPPDGEVWCSVRSGVCFAIAPTLFWVGSFAAREEEREHTFEAWIERGHMLEIRPHDSALKRGRFGTTIPTAVAQTTGIPGVAIKALTLERIHRASPQTLAFFSADSAAIADPRAEAARLVRDFAARAFRQPITDAEAAPYVALAHAELDAGAPLRDALRGAYRGVLSSPRFLYLEESVGPLSNHALASRLSYFLWRSPPDEELRALAAAGRLTEPAVLRAQVERLLQHPNAEAFIEDFTGQWLNLDEIDFTVPDAKLYPEFDEVLKHAMLDETRRFFAELVRRDLGVGHLVDAPFTFMNSRLARHYGVPWPGGEGVQRVALRPEHRRGGIMTHGSVLKVTANGTSTSPVLRGVWMLERLMGIHVPPVPADVPALEPDIRGAKTIREQLDKHRNTASCAVCHVKIDPPGFALESYDVTGAWRDHYRVPKTQGKGFVRGPAVDPSFTMADGRPFADIVEFKQILLGDPDQLARNLAEKLVAYATGASISFADRAALEEIVASTRDSQHGVRSILHAVVASHLFRDK